MKFDYSTKELNADLSEKIYRTDSRLEVREMRVKNQKLKIKTELKEFKKYNRRKTRWVI